MKGKKKSHNLYYIWIVKVVSHRGEKRRWRDRRTHENKQPSEPSEVPPGRDERETTVNRDERKGMNALCHKDCLGKPTYIHSHTYIDRHKERSLPLPHLAPLKQREKNLLLETLLHLHVLDRYKSRPRKKVFITFHGETLCTQSNH